MLTNKKTFLLNGAALAVALLQHYAGALPEVDPQLAAIAFAVSNLVLRVLRLKFGW